ncbi:MAG: TolC family protein [Holophagales bacterium]|nr:TolC family protein [Holophagales bacterium]
MRYGVAVAVLGLVASGAVRADDPISLGEAMSRARGGAREVAAAKARQEAATARVSQASAYRLPSLTLSETYIRTDSPAESFALELNRNEFSFPNFVGSDPNDPGWSGTAITRAEAMVPLFTGGELSGRIDQARSAAEAAGSQTSWAADNAALNAGEAWVMLAQAEEFVSLLTKARDTVKAHVELAKSYVGQGMLVRSELLRAEVELARVEDLLEDAKGKARVANANLAFRIGVAQDSTWQLAPLPGPKPLDGDAASWVASAASRKDLAAARSLLRAGELEEKVKKAAWFPKVGVSARWDLHDKNLFGASGSAGTVMAFAAVNLFQGGADKAAVAAAREEARAGREDVARFADGVALEVRQAYEEAVPPAPATPPPSRRSSPPARASGSPTNASRAAS